MPSLTDVFVAILPDTTQFGRQLQTQLRRIDASSTGRHVGGTFTSGFSGATKGIAAGLAGAFAAVGAVSLFKGFIADAAEAAKITRITENTIKSMGGVANVSASQITSLAGSLAAKTGIDDAAIQSGQNLLLTFGNVRNEVGKGNDVFTQATRLGLDMSVALGTDASGAALQLGKALNDPVKGIGALSRAGVSFTEQQKEQIKTLVASGDTLGAQKIILGELEKQFGGTAAAAADPMARLSFVVGELGESVGALLLPAVTAFADFAGTKVIPAIQGLVNGFSGGEAAAGRFSGVFERIKATVGPVLVEIQGGVRALVEAFRSGGEEVTRSGFAGGMQQIGIFARDAFDYIKSDVIPAALAVGRALRELGQGALPIAVAAFKSLFDSLTGVFNFVKANDTVFSSLAAGLVAGYAAFVVVTAVTNAFKAAQVAAMLVTTAYKAVLQAYAIWTYTATGATTAFAFAQHVLKAAFLSNPIGIVVIALVALGAALFVAYKKSETFRDIVNGAWAAIKGSVGGVVDWFQSSVLPVLQGVWDGVSGGAVTLWHGLQAAWDGIRVGFGAAMSGFMAVYDNVIAPVFGAFKAAAQFLWDGVEKVWVGIRVGFGAAMVGFRAVYDNLIAPVFGAFKAAALFLWEGVEVIWAGIKAGFSLAMTGFKIVYDNVIAPVFGAFKAAAGLLWEGVKFFWEAIKIDFALAMTGLKAVYDNVIAPLFAAFKAAAQFLWDGVKVIWEGIKVGFDLAMRGVKVVYDHIIVPLFDAFKAAAQFLWDGVEVIWDGMKSAFDTAMDGIKAVYDKVIVPLFDAFKVAAQLLWDGVKVIWDGIKTGFDTAMRGLKAVYDNVLKPLWDTFADGVRGLKAIFDTVVDGIGRTWDTLKDKMRAPIKIAFDWVNANVIDKVRGVISAITGGSVNLPNLPSLAKGGPVEGPGGPRDDKVLMWGSAGEFMVNAKAAKKHRGLLKDINAGRKPERLPGDETGGPVGDVWGTITGAADAIKGFAADMLTKGARKAAEFLLNPLKDRLFSLIGSGNVVSAVLRGGLEKLFAAVLSKGDEKDKEMAAAKKAGGIGAFPGGGTGTGLIAFARLMQSMGARVSEHPLFGGVNPVHTRGSNHYIGRAVDVNYGPGGENATEKAFFDQVVARGLPRQYGLRYIWRAPGHFNHLHADYDRGGWLQPGATGANRGRKPEAVLTDPQWTNIDRLVKALERGQQAATAGEMGGPSFNFNVYNPIAEPTSVTTNKALQRAADLALV